MPCRVCVALVTALSVSMPTGSSLPTSRKMLGSGDDAMLQPKGRAHLEGISG